MARDRWAHVRLTSGPWLAAAVVVPVVLAVVASLAGRDHVETALEQRTTTLLEDRGVSPAGVDFDGVEGRVVVDPDSLPSGLGRQRIETLLGDVSGARGIRLVVDGRRVGADQATVEPQDAGEPQATAAPVRVADPACGDVQGDVEEILGPDRVAFGNSGAVVPEDQRAELAEAAVLLVRCGSRVDVLGHTSDRAVSGSTVGSDRADAVADLLRGAGVDVGAAQGRRDEDPIGDNSTREGRALNRYAEVVVRGGGG